MKKNSLIARVPEEWRNGLAALGAVVLVFGSFLTVSGDLDIDAPFGLAGVFSSLTGSPNVVITKDINSPAGNIVPGRSQALAVFDVKANNITQKALMERTVVNVVVSGDTSLTLDNFVLDYRFCVPAGNIYAYGYQYSYQGMFCRSASAWPVSTVRVGNTYTVTFAPQFVIYPGQTVSNIMLSGYAHYPMPSTAKTIGKVRASLLKNNTAVQTTKCTTWRYGYAYRYSYTTCRATGISATVSGAVGNTLSVLRTYGYTPTISTPPKGVTPIDPPVPPGDTTSAGTTGSSDTGAAASSGSSDASITSQTQTTGVSTSTKPTTTKTRPNTRTR